MTITTTAPTMALGYTTPAAIAASDERIAAYRAAAAALTGEDWERIETMRAEMAAGTRAPDAAERRRRILETSPRSTTRPGFAPAAHPENAMTTDTTIERLRHAREIIIRAVAVLEPVEIDADADVAETLAIATAIETRANLRDEDERIASLIGRHPAAREYRNEFGDVTTDPAVAEGWSDAAIEADYRDPGADWRPFNYEGTEAVTADRIAHYAAREAVLAGKDA